MAVVIKPELAQRMKVRKKKWKSRRTIAGNSNSTSNRLSDEYTHQQQQKEEENDRNRNRQIFVC